jgi:hypothetical protein
MIVRLNHVVDLIKGFVEGHANFTCVDFFHHCLNHFHIDVLSLGNASEHQSCHSQLYTITDLLAEKLHFFAFVDESVIVVPDHNHRGDADAFKRFTNDCH